MLLKLKLLFVFSTLCFASFGFDDSTGVILKNEKVFILHKVENGQGLYGVARRYKTIWTKVRDANPGSETKIMPGQILLVPTGKTEKQFFGNKTPKYSKNNSEYSKPVIPKVVEKEKTPETPDVNKSPKTSFTVFYTVQKGETLFSIAQKFGTTADFLRQLNKMANYSVAVGKDILVPMTETIATDTVIAQKEAEVKQVQKELDEITAKIEEEKRREKERIDSLSKSAVKPVIKDEESKKNKETKDKKNETETIDSTDKSDKNPKIVVDEAKKEEKIIPKPATPEYNIVVENLPEYDVEKVIETGQGKVMTDNTINQSKDWVIHHNAAENTALQITNPANNKSIYVKVVKNFVRKENDPLILYITKNTAEYLELSKKDKFVIKIIFAK